MSWSIALGRPRRRIAEMAATQAHSLEDAAERAIARIDEDDALAGGRERVGLHLTREERRERALRNSPFSRA
jgi:hypothetical protein